LASLKNLAGQTIWYGLSNIAAKLLYVLMTPLLTYVLHTRKGVADFGDFSVIYAGISFANVVFTYGMETAYFRFSATKEVDKERLYQTSFGSLIITTLILSALLFYFSEELSRYAGFSGHPEYIRLAVIIIAVDTLVAIPFARLRQEGRPRMYAFTRIAGIVVTIILTVVFIALSPGWVEAHPDNLYAHWYGQFTNPALILIANLAGSATTFLVLWREWSGFRFRIDAALWHTIIKYSTPFIIIGLGGMVNETLDRIMLRRLLPGDPQSVKIAVAIYAANYRIAIFITLFIQAFRMAAEPFFFAQSTDKDAPKTYAKVMKWFVITLCFAFLFTALFLDIWKYMVGGAYRSGLGVVPILLYANIFLGVYYNLSVWYKISGQLKWGIFITLFGAMLTLVINFSLIPLYGMWACAWATFICYFSMMVVSYFAGQYFFPVPYTVRKLLTYLIVMSMLFFAQKGVYFLTGDIGSAFIIRMASGAVLMLVFVRLVWVAERKELQGFPLIGKYM
jgi:O-antigen/teichoic acid export membrane protein